MGAKGKAIGMYKKKLMVSHQLLNHHLTGGNYSAAITAFCSSNLVRVSA